jgi:hypothetical protein
MRSLSAPPALLSHSRNIAPTLAAPVTPRPLLPLSVDLFVCPFEVITLDMAEILGEDAVPENRAAPTRKFTEDHDVALLKEVIACGAHVSRRGSQMDKFEEVSTALNNSGALPWATDAKHCLNRFK